MTQARTWPESSLKAQLEHFLVLFAVADFTDARIAALIESRMAAREQL